MAALSDATLLAISRISVGAQVADPTDFTALTSAQVMAKFELSSYGGDAGSSLYALGSDGDYDALDPDDPPVTDLGIWPVGAFVNYAVNGLLTGAVAGSPGTLPTGVTTYNFTVTAISVGTYKGLPLLTIEGSTGAASTTFENNNTFTTADGDVLHGSGYFGFDGSALGSALVLIQDDWGSGSNLDCTSALSIALRQLSRTVDVVEGAPDYSNFRGHINMSAAGTLEFQVAGKQVVKNIRYHPPVRTLSGAATTTKLAAITQREVSVWKPFVVVIEATTGEDPGAHQVFYSLSRSANELIEIYRATSTDQMTLKIRSGGVDYTDALGSVADNTAFTLAVNVFARSSAASLNGGTTQVLVAPKPSGVLTLESIGCKHDGTLQCGGPIAECNLIHPAVYTAEQLEAA